MKLYETYLLQQQDKDNISKEINLFELMIIQPREAARISAPCAAVYQKKLSYHRKVILSALGGFILASVPGSFIALMIFLFSSTGRLYRYAFIQCSIKGLRYALTKLKSNEQDKKQKYQKEIQRLLKARINEEKAVIEKLKKLQQKSNTKENWKGKSWLAAATQIYHQAKSETP
jgi:membrane protein insertase Oxa1/YidC/SpoIIIJ